MKRTLLLIGIALLGAAFAGAGFPAGQKIETLDGVRVVHNPAGGQWGKSPAVSLQPVRVLGDVDSDDEAIAFHMPSGLVVDAQGRLYVLDSGNHRVQVFGADGKFLKTIGRQGQGPGEFYMPNAIDFDAQGNLYVCESQAARIQAIAPDGKIAKTLKLTEGAVGDTRVLKRGGFVMTAGMGGGMIRIGGPQGGQQEAAAPPLLKMLDAGGKTLREFGKPADFGDFLVNRMANQVLTALDESDNVYAIFPFQNRIEKYSPDGKLLWKADRPLAYSMEIKAKGEMKTGNSSGGGQTVSIRMPDLARCAGGTAVDSKGRLWVVTLDRQLRENEKVSVSMMMSNNGGAISGKQEAKGAVDVRTTDAYRLEVYEPDGVLLGSVPVKTFVDGIFIKGDRLFLLDKVRGVQFHEFKIIG
ncbi:MAG: NHL repeat-containing protein [Candidatus Aminicenantes bacterium]|nr:NHL repeat-containing protein [Candidatus Aminicenantes bacterium]